MIRVGAAVVAAASLLLNGCGDSPSPTRAATDETGAPSPAERDEVEFARLLNGGGRDPRQLPATPAELTAHSDVVVAAHLIGVRDGRLWGTPPNAVTTVVLEAQVTDVLAGSLPGQDRDVIYVEFVSQGSRPASFYDDIAPVDAPMTLYLRRVDQFGAGDMPPMPDPDAGRPKGRALWQIVSPLGFAIEDDEGGLVFGTGKTSTRATQQDVQPDAKTWPTMDEPAPTVSDDEPYTLPSVGPATPK